MAFFDPNDLEENHLSMCLDNLLTVWGAPAEVFRPVVFENEFKDFAPEVDPTPAPVGECKVFLEKPVTGLNLSQMIFRADKVQTRYTFVSDTELGVKDEILITYPDNKTLRLRVFEPLTTHDYSAAGFVYVGIVI